MEAFGSSEECLLSAGEPGTTVRPKQDHTQLGHEEPSRKRKTQLVSLTAALP